MNRRRIQNSKLTEKRRGSTSLEKRND